jgi:hypothetical protein
LNEAAQNFTAELRRQPSPFYFQAAADLTRIATARAHTLSELLENLKTCSQASVFYHTFQTLHEHHYIREGFTNDFAHWAFAACNEVGLAEKLAAVDVRDFTSMESLREKFVLLLGTHLERNPVAGLRTAFEPFYFLAAETIEVPTPFVAHTVEEFAECIQNVSLGSIQHHFISARLRLKLKSNDFSVWLEEEAGLEQVAARLNRIDIYTNTLNDVRRRIYRTVQLALKEKP